MSGYLAHRPNTFIPAEWANTKSHCAYSTHCAPFRKRAQLRYVTGFRLSTSHATYRIASKRVLPAQVLDVDSCLRIFQHAMICSSACRFRMFLSHSNHEWRAGLR
jgi:hypothetical protein